MESINGWEYLLRANRVDEKKKKLHLHLYIEMKAVGSRINRHSTVAALASPYYACMQLLSSISTAAADAAYQM